MARKVMCIEIAFEDSVNGNHWNDIVHEAVAELIDPDTNKILHVSSHWHVVSDDENIEHTVEKRP